MAGWRVTPAGCKLAGAYPRRRRTFRARAPPAPLLALRSFTPFALALVSAALVGCDADYETLGPTCAPSYGAAVAVVARDAQTGAVLPAAGTRGAVRDGAFVDSLVPVAMESPEVRTLLAGGARAGTYTITLERVGYRVWTREGVTVVRGVCGIVTVGLITDLERLP